MPRYIGIGTVCRHPLFVANELYNHFPKTMPGSQKLLHAGNVLYFAGDLSQVEPEGARLGLHLVTSETEDHTGTGRMDLNYLIYNKG
jgi:hypothetical protein